MNRTSKICMLIINYNGLKFLNTYVHDLAYSCNKNDIFFIVTDDSSTDGSIKYLVENGYNFTINDGKSRGFAANVNHGIRYAKTIQSFDYFIISNNDIKIDNQLFLKVRDTLDALSANDPKLGLIGFDEVLEYRVDYFRKFDYDLHKIDDLQVVNSIPGFFFIISDNLISTIGLLDEEYFMYGEDNDYFLRTVKAGFRIYNTCLPILHFSEGSSSNFKVTSWYVYRNAFLCAQKNSGFLTFFVLFLSFIYKIYNPFYKSSHPSNLRIKRNGFLYNNYLLGKSLLWNFKYYIKDVKRLS